MSDSQVGGRKKRSICNHLFVLYSVINDAQVSKRPIDINLYDVEKCFDGLWLDECLNDFYEAGIHDDKLALIHKGNQMNYVSV